MKLDEVSSPGYLTIFFPSSSFACDKLDFFPHLFQTIEDLKIGSLAHHFKPLNVSKLQMMCSKMSAWVQNSIARGGKGGAHTHRSNMGAASPGELCKQNQQGLLNWMNDPKPETGNLCASNINGVK